jgi:hypothetical protein
MTRHRIFLTLFYFFPTVIPSVYTDKIFSSVKFITIYRRNISINIFICIYQFSNSDKNS